MEYNFGKKKKKTVNKTNNVDTKPSETNIIDIIVDKPLTDEQEKLLMKSQDEIDDVYNTLLDKLYDCISESKKSDTKTKIPHPKSYKKNKKTIWENFEKNCQSINRSMDHVMAFILAEYGCTGSIDGKNQLNINGKYLDKHFENTFKKYISEYVVCKTCKSLNTEFIKDNRLQFMKCHDCKSEKQIQNIKKGFHAETRADRIQKKNKL